MVAQCIVMSDLQSRNTVDDQSRENGLEELLRRARDGDEDARNDLFRTCRAYVGFLARSHVESWIQSKVDASDLVQQTLLEAHQAFPRFTGQSEGEWLAWLKQILKHNATDYVRRYGAQKRRARLEVALGGGDQSSLFRAAPELSARIDTPSAIVNRREEEVLVANALETLPDDYQEVIVLRNLQRLPFDEVAERMGRSRPATQMLWMRALRKLQSVLGQQSNVSLE
jgi:RNA polymerase sigma-70 factor (ECF subfamily)